MIIVTDAYVAASAVSANNPRIGYQSHMRDLGLTASDVEVSSEDAEGPRDAPLRESTEDFWEPTSLPATWEVSFGAFRDVNYVGILGYNLDGVQVLVESTDGASAGSPPSEAYETFASDLIAGDDSPIMLLDALRSISGVRITLSAAVAPTEMPKITSVYAGQVLEMARPCYGGIGPMSMSRVSVLYNALTQGGQLVGQGFRRHGQAGTLAFQNLTAAWIRAYFDPFIKHARNLPFFVAWRPSTFPLEVSYAWCGADLKPVNQSKRDFMQVSIPMMGIGFE